MEEISRVTSGEKAFDGNATSRQLAALSSKVKREKEKGLRDSATKSRRPERRDDSQVWLLVGVIVLGLFAPTSGRSVLNMD